MVLHGRMKIKRFVKIILPFLFLTMGIVASAQNITSNIPKNISKTEKYIFYLHGGVVQSQGAKAVSEYFGRYEYQKILDALRDKGFNVISEVRPKDTKVSDYAKKVAKQVKQMKKSGVPYENITIVGASLGAYMTIEAAHKLRKKKVKFVLIGLCSEYALDYYAKYNGKLRGNFLSIYEETDEKSSCQSIFDKLHRKTKFKEIKTNMGNGHAFLFEPYDDWINPLVKWIEVK